MLEWFQFAYTGDRSGEYVAPGLSNVTFHTPEEGVSLFALDLQRICTLYPGAYAQGSTYNLESVPGGTEYGQKRPNEVPEVGKNVVDLFLSGGDPSTIWAHERG